MSQLLGDRQGHSSACQNIQTLLLSPQAEPNPEIVKSMYKAAMELPLSFPLFPSPTGVELAAYLASDSTL